MRNDRDDFGAVSWLLHERFDHVPVRVELAQRVEAIVSASLYPTADRRIVAAPPIGEPVRQSHRRQRRVILAAVAAVAVLIGGAVVATHSIRAKPSQIDAGPASLVGVSEVTACETPNGPFAHFYVFDRDGSGQAIYQDTVKVGAAAVPTSSIYASHGPIGSGYLCVSNTVGPGRSEPIRAVLEAHPGALAYLGLIDGAQPWGAVAPGITSIRISVSGQPDDVYTLNSAEEYLLRPIGAGWHVFNSAGGFAGNGPVKITVTAYAGTAVSDTRVVTTGTIQSSQSAPQPSR